MSNPINRRRFVAALLGAASAVAPQAAEAGMGGAWLRFQPSATIVAAAPIVATVPAVYSSATSSDALFNGPTPSFSLGPNGVPLMLDQTLVSQGGTGVLTDTLLDAGIGAGDTSGFGVVNGELMLVDDLLFYYRTSGAARIMRWVQTLGPQTLSQDILLALDPTQGRIWNGLTPDARRGSSVTTSLAYHQFNFTQADFPLTTGLYVPPQGWPGLTYFVGCPDARRIAGLKKAVSGPAGALVIHPDLAAFCTIYQQGIGEQVPTNGRSCVPVFRIGTVAQASLKIIDGFDFSGVFLSVNQNNYKLTNCYMDASGWQMYQQFPGVNILLRNCRLGDDGDTDRSHMYIDNLADVLALHGQNGIGIYGRTLIPSGPGSFADYNFDPFMGPSQQAQVYLADVGTNAAGHQFIKLSLPVPTNNATSGLPAGLNVWLGLQGASDARNPDSRGNPMPNNDYSTAGLLAVQAGVLFSMEDTTIDARVSGYKYGMVGNNHLPVAGTGGFGPQSDANGVFRGVRRCCIVGSPQDPYDSCVGTLTQSALIAGALNNGSHVDGIQNIDTPNLSFAGERPASIVTNCVVDDRKRYAGPDHFVDPIVNGVSTNPWFSLYGATKLNHGGQNAVIYDENGNGSSGAPSYGDFVVSGSWLRGGAFGIYVTSDNKPPCYFTQSNPVAIALAGAWTVQNPNNLSTFPGYIVGEKVAFNPGNLPPAITPYKVYTVAGYPHSFVTVDTRANAPLQNTTSGLAVGDILVGTNGTIVNGGLGQATFAVASVDANGKALTLKIVNPGQYNWNAKATTLAIQSAVAGSAAGTLAILPSYSVSVLLTDPATGTLVSTAASATGTGIVAGNTSRQTARGLHAFHDNFLSEQSVLTAMRLDYKTGYTSATDAIQKDAAGNWRTMLDAVSLYNNAWLYGAPAGAPTVDPATGFNALPLVGIHNLSDTTPSLNPPPNPVTTLALAVAGSQIQVSFAPDGNARSSPDGGVLNPSGYQYMIRPSGGAWPSTWSHMPAVTASGGLISTVLPDAVSKGQPYDVKVRPVSCYSSPEMVPLVYPADSNVPTITTPA